jgi:hypothetical protein
MHSQGFVVQASVDDQRGLIHAGGTDQSSFLSFRFADCNGPVQQQLMKGDIPPGPSFPVQFDVTFDNGHLIAVNIT